MGPARIRQVNNLYFCPLSPIALQSDEKKTCLVKLGRPHTDHLAMPCLFLCRNSIILGTSGQQLLCSTGCIQ